MLDLNQVPARNAAVIGQTINQEAVLLLPVTGAVIVLNEVGARIWDLIDSQRTIRAIAATIHREYEVSAADAEQDTLVFVATLLGRNMATLSNG